MKSVQIMPPHRKYDENVQESRHIDIVGDLFERAMAMKLSEPQKRHLRALGHHLKPVVWVGQHGLKASVLTEAEQALDSHELIKVKIAAERDTRKILAAELCAQTRAELIDTIGQMVILFRRNEKKPKIALPSA